MAYDRYRFIEDPSKQRLPAVVFAIGTWLTASCIVVPYPIYTTFLEISLPWGGGAAGQPEQKLQLCVANLGNDIHDYLRCMFVLLYVVPAISLAYLHAQTSRVLREKRTPVTLVLYEPRAARSPRPSAASLPLTGCRRSAPIRSSLYQTDSAELDLAKETRTQRYLCVMTASFFALFAPLNLMRVLKMHLHETYENTFNFDIAFATLVWVGYLPTCTMPIIVGNWMLSRSEKERVRGYLRFSYRRLTRSGHRSTYSRPPGQAGPPADAVAADDHTALSTPGPSPPHGVAHGNRTASVATASTAITNLSPPTSPKPSPRPSPRPARGSTAAPAAAAVLPAPAAAPLSEVNLMKHDLQRVPSHRHRIPLGPASPSTSTSSSRTSSSFLHNPFLPIGPPAPSSVDSPVPTTSDSTPTSPPAPATGLPGERCPRSEE
ncbi:hypothetical protein ONE63_009379 [Megalurothrips usitatus]|uniref:G-protein coupled receptors family 1 profile domain-containing protein n=1 Tax=Megalurothrips usitatus TaxID=439358 RepID=A0AAV7XP62_9NEOP|nr:hypothetical protein ONE63_009379 [Megalurothrips usitatus]